MKARTILVVHGWDYNNYTSVGSINAWSNRARFLSELSTRVNVVPINLPGFGGEPDPSRAWSLDDYASWLAYRVEAERPDCLLGYSFGGAVLLRLMSSMATTNARVVLVSPAIARRYATQPPSAWLTAIAKRLPSSWRALLRDFYLVHVVKNEYYTLATPVMRATYLNIIGLDLRDELHDLPMSTTLVYGADDTATPVDAVRPVLDGAAARHTLHVIDGAGHDVANSHTDTLAALVAAEAHR